MEEKHCTYINKDETQWNFGQKPCKKKKNAVKYIQ